MKLSIKRAWVALHRNRHITDNVLRRLILAKDSPEQIMALSYDELTEIGVPASVKQALINCINPQNKQDRQTLDQDWRLLDSHQIEVLPLSSDCYPELLKQISDPPPLLYIKGKISLLDRPQVAMVGSRKPSRQGGENAFWFSRELAKVGFTVTSGLAQGIDTYSHQGALDAGGTTIAVLGCGIDRVYPASNRLLYKKIIDSGVIISEFPLSSEPKRYHFPQRNRVISGLSLGVLVVEAALKSGSLISARCAMEQNREVFAIPGSIHNPASKGCHALISQGATLVETVSDIMNEFSAWCLGANEEKPHEHMTSTREELEPIEKTMLDIVGYDPVTIDTLLQRSGWSVTQLNTLLTSLELKGLIENTAGIYQRLTR